MSASDPTAHGSDKGGPPPSFPLPAVVYGSGGLIPFAACAVAAWLLPSGWIAALVFVQLAYGATILSFLGAVHWGVALAGQGANGDSFATCGWTRLGLSVLPALVAWVTLGAIFAPDFLDLALLTQMLTFAALLAGDIQAARRHLMPAWYPRLRQGLTLIVLLALGASLLRVVWV